MADFSPSLPFPLHAVGAMAGLSYSANPAWYIVGQAVENRPHLITGFADSYSIFPPTLPEGLKFDTVTGIISGSPLLPTPETTYTIVATGTGGQVVVTVTIYVHNGAFAVTFHGAPFPVACGSLANALMGTLSHAFSHDRPADNLQCLAAPNTAPSVLLAFTEPGKAQAAVEFFSKDHNIAIETLVKLAGSELPCGSKVSLQLGPGPKDTSSKPVPGPTFSCIGENGAIGEPSLCCSAPPPPSPPITQG